MRILLPAALALGLAGCVAGTPVMLPDDHPASPAAPVGAVELPTALSEYRSADRFETPPPDDGAVRGHAGHAGGAPAGAHRH